MRLTVSIFVALLLAGCGGGGGGGGGDSQISCQPADGKTCSTMILKNGVLGGCSAPRVSSCSTAGVLATCTEDFPDSHITIRVYDATVLSEVEQECNENGGVWQTN